MNDLTIERMHREQSYRPRLARGRASRTCVPRQSLGTRTTGDFTMRILATVSILFGLFAASASSGQEPKKYRVYIGTYTGKNSKGIYRCDLDLATGKLSEPVLAAESNSPSF